MARVSSVAATTNNFLFGWWGRVCRERERDEVYRLDSNASFLKI